MNFHVEHHFFQNVPVYALPKLHQTLKSQLPQLPKILIAGWKQIFPALLVQRKNPNYFFEPILPATNLWTFLFH
jgi:fatty acid desaturase